ncbi:MAG TPA: hypothetical protein VFL31_01985 [Nitrospiraceae bacterium]|nr:hypothetical protein [Nitrospiraceae bacterium]
MPDLEYRVIPFIGVIRGGFFSQENATTVANQLEKLINEGSQQGWEFFRIDPVQIHVSPGCLGSLFGQKEAYIRFDQVIFKRTKGSR